MEQGGAETGYLWVQVKHEKEQSKAEKEWRGAWPDDEHLFVIFFACCVCICIWSVWLVEELWCFSPAEVYLFV